MMDMSSWPTKTLDIMKVGLDPLNVRLDMAPNVPEADVIEQLFEHAKTFALVESIASVGFLTYETPVVVRRDGAWVVVEGNRRLAALKVLQNPLLAPKFSARISTIRKSIPNIDALRKIDFRVAPNQGVADQLVAIIHTTNLRIVWTPPRQTAFFEMQLQQGRSLQELEVLYPTVDVANFVERARILEAFRTAAYADPATSDFLSSSKFKVSALERIYESSDFKRLTGIGIDGDGKLTLSVSRPCWDAMADVIVSGMKDGLIDTRKLPTVTSPRFRQLIEDLTAVRNDIDGVPSGAQPSDASQSRPGSGPVSSPQNGRSGGSGNSGSASAAGGAGAAAGGSDAKKPKGPNPTKPATLVGSDYFTVPHGFPHGIHHLVKEMESVAVSNHPHILHDVLRTLLEKSIKAYADGQGEDIRKSVTVKDFVQLGHCLQWLESYLRAHGHKAEAQIAKQIRDGRVKVFGASADQLNAINHNHKVVVNADIVRDTWSTILPLLIVMMPK